MELIYPNKKSRQEILNFAERCNYNKLIESDDKSNLFFWGDNLNLLSALLNSEYKNQIDLIYIDPPYNTNQIFTISSDRASTISRERRNNNLIAYSDNFLTIGDYLEFMRERLILMRELLSEQGSLYVHIDMKMGHYLKLILDEIFGIDNFINDITRIKSNPKNFNRRGFGNEKDMILFYAKNSKKNIFNNITSPLSEEEKVLMFKKIDNDGKRYNTVPVHAPGETLRGDTGREWKGMLPPKGRHWRVSPKELDILDKNNLIEWSKNGVPRIKKFADDHKGKKIQDVWVFKDPAYPIYPTEKNSSMLEMIILQSSNPDSIIMDCFSGSGTTLKIANKLGRKWIGADISKASFDIIKSSFDSESFKLIVCE